MASLSPLWLKITDFGIAKRWGGTELRTQCGTVSYQAPELLGLLPRRMRPTGQSYTPSIDIWALGAVVHQVLTSDVPFTESSPAMTGSTSVTQDWSSIDAELLLDYCAGREVFPIASLSKQGASAGAINFVKSLMVADPKERVSAADALKHAWLSSAASISPSLVESRNRLLRGLNALAVDDTTNETAVASRRHPSPRPPINQPGIPLNPSSLAITRATPSYEIPLVILCIALPSSAFFN